MLKTYVNKDFGVFPIVVKPTRIVVYYYAVWQQKRRKTKKRKKRS